ncbi:MAG: IclR family transcriptional regulator [Sphaerochaeta sp.]|nr:IclR family transcriptional regulator [Sphaerochaeta sp.]
MEEQNRVLAVERVMSILEYLAQEGSATLSQMARDVSLHKSTLFRFLSTLTSLGYVYKDSGSETYSLTQKMNHFTHYTHEHSLLHEFAIPIMEALASTTQETIHLATMENGKIHYISKIESTQSLRVVTSSQSGGDAPVYCTGLGKALLAAKPEDEKRTIVQSLSFFKYTANTITEQANLHAELLRIKAHGYAIDNEEHEEGIFCIAAPIMGKDKKALAAISITGPAFRMKQNKESYIQLLQEKIQLMENHIR